MYNPHSLINTQEDANMGKAKRPPGRQRRECALQASIVEIKKWDSDLARRLSGDDGLEYENFKNDAAFYNEKKHRLRNALLEAGVLLLKKECAHLAREILGQAAYFTTSPALLSKIRRYQRHAVQAVALHKKQTSKLHSERRASLRSAQKADQKDVPPATAET